MTGHDTLTYEEWRRRAKRQVEQRLAHLEGTTRYRLGLAMLEVLRRPWRLPRLRSPGAPLTPSAKRDQPAFDVRPPLPRPFGAAPAPPSEIEALIRETNQIRARGDRIESSPAYRLGSGLVELWRSPWRVALLPLALLWAALERRKSAAPEDKAPEVRAPGAAVRVEGTPGASRPAMWASIAPPWLQYALAVEGIAPLGETAAKPDALLAALDEVPTVRVREWLLGDGLRRGSETRLAIWLTGSSFPESAGRVLRAADALFAADPDLAGRASAQLGRQVLHLPPAIQPRLHNPINWWEGLPGIRAPGESEGLPEGWGALRRMACFGACGGGVKREVERLLGNALPRGAVPRWAPSALAAGWERLPALRQILTRETIAARLHQVDRALGLPLDPAPEPLASVLICTNREGYLDNLFDSFARQTYTPRELVLVLHGEDFDFESVRDRASTLAHPARILHAPASRTLGEILQQGADATVGEVIVRMDDDDWYGRRYLHDMVLGLAISGAGVVGKYTEIVYLQRQDRFMLRFPGAQYRPGRLHNGGTLGFRRQVLDEVSFRRLPSREDLAFCRDCAGRSIPMLSIDAFNFVRVRRHNRHHTWKPTPDALYGNVQWLPAEASMGDFEV